MCCYIVPAAAALVHFFFRRGVTALKSDRKQALLGQLLLGGTIFGVVDHAWNGELFLVGPNIADDLALGMTITAAIFLSWGIMLIYDKIIHKNADRSIS